MDIKGIRPQTQESSGFRPVIPPAGGPEAHEAGPQDAYRPTGDAADEGRHERQGSQIPDIGAAFGDGGVESKEAQDRKEDEKLLLQNCGPGCECSRCSVGMSDNPLKGLEDRDQEVRTHENEHLAAAGELAQGGPEFEMVTSKSGKSFAVGGKVNVDVAEIQGDPQKTIDKMKKIQKAALAPATPSEQDLRVAAEASGKESKAQGELQQKNNPVKEEL